MEVREVNCSYRDMSSHFHTKEDALVIENAVKTAVRLVLDAIYSVNNDKLIEYQRTVADRNQEISRLKHKLKQTENELLKALLQQRGECCPTSGNLDSCSGRDTTMHRNDATPSTENETANEQHCNRELSSFGERTPPLVPSQCQDGAATVPSNQADLDQQMCTSHSSATTTDPPSPASLKPKEEPSDGETVFIKWEMCEQSLGGRKEGDGRRGQKNMEDCDENIKMYKKANSKVLSMTQGKLTNAEKQKMYRERCRATPEGLHAYKERQRQRYLKSRTLVSEIPEEMRSLKRAYWRAAARRSRVRKTVQTERIQHCSLAQEEDPTQSHHLPPSTSPSTTQRLLKPPPYVVEVEDERRDAVQYS